MTILEIMIGSRGGTLDCKHGCGCWMGPARSGSGHTGVDPGGRCPMNLKREKIKDFFGLGSAAGLSGITVAPAYISKELQVVDFVNARIEALEKMVAYLDPYKSMFDTAKKTRKVKLVEKIKHLELKNLALKNTMVM